MSTATEPGEIGITVHFLTAMSLHQSTGMHADAVNVGYGSEVILTERVIDANKDAFGYCRLIDLLDDEDGQVKSWGKVVIRRGPWPEGKDRLQPGSPAFDDRRTAALRAASQLPDPDAARAAVAKVREQFGSNPESRSRTLKEYRA